MGYKLKRIMMWVNNQEKQVRPNRLPSAYQEVERIQSSGTQHIDTGFTPSNTTKVELKMGDWSNVGTYQNLFGTRQNWSASGKGFLLGFTLSNYSGMFGKSYLWNTSTFDFADGGDHVLEMSQAGIYQDGTQMVTLDSATFTAVVSLCIFADNDNGTANEKSSYKLYYFKIWDDNTLVREFVPCYRIADSVIGLYDTVNDQFYTNAGTGTFTKGPNV